MPTTGRVGDQWAVVEESDTRKTFDASRIKVTKPGGGGVWQLKYTNASVPTVRVQG